MCYTAQAIRLDVARALFTALMLCIAYSIAFCAHLYMLEPSCISLVRTYSSDPYRAMNEVVLLLLIPASNITTSYLVVTLCALLPLIMALYISRAAVMRGEIFGIRGMLVASAILTLVLLVVNIAYYMLLVSALTNVGVPLHSVLRSDVSVLQQALIAMSTAVLALVVLSANKLTRMLLCYRPYVMRRPIR